MKAREPTETNANLRWGESNEEYKSRGGKKNVKITNLVLFQNPCSYSLQGCSSHYDMLTTSYD